MENTLKGSPTRSKGAGDSMRRLAVALLIGSLALPCSALTLGELADIFEAMESSIADVSIEYEWYNQEPSTAEDTRATGLLSPASREECSFTTAKPFLERQLYSRKVDFSTPDGRVFTSDVRYAYNGDVFKQVTIGAPNEHSPEGLITNRKDMLRKWNLTPMAFTVFRFYREGLLSQGLREHPKSFRVVDEIGQVRDFRTVELDCVTDTGAVHTRVFLSVDHGYAPVRFEYVSLWQKAVTVEVDVLALEEVADGLWFPVKGTTGWDAENARNVYEAKAVKINQNLSRDDFDLEFPPGSVVSDQRRTSLRKVMVLAILPIVAIAGIAIHRRVRFRSRAQGTAPKAHTR